MTELRFRSNSRFYFEHKIDFSSQVKRARASPGNLIVCIVKERRLLVNLYRISMQEDTLLVCRNAFYLDSLNINDLPRLT